jgi:hypothetical protein
MSEPLIHLISRINMTQPSRVEIFEEGFPLSTSRVCYTRSTLPADKKRVLSFYDRRSADPSYPAFQDFWVKYKSPLGGPACWSHSRRAGRQEGKLCSGDSRPSRSIATLESHKSQFKVVFTVNINYLIF